VTSRAALTLCAALVVCAAAAQAHAATVPLRPGEPPLPGDLLVLAQKMEGLSVNSERFRLRTGLTLSGHASREEQRLLNVFSIDVSGEATLSPPAGSFTLVVFGQKLEVRIVYAYEPTLARHDGGRPWIDLGAQGFGPLTPSLPSSSAGNTFQSLARALKSALGANELGQEIIDGFSATGFRATVAASALEEPAAPAKPPSILEGIFGRSAAAHPGQGAPSSAVVEAFIAPNGLPVRTHISASSEGASASALLEVFAINFALRVHRPPRRLTIGLARLRKLSESSAGRPSAERRED
jgi:hypothetical protein